VFGAFVGNAIGIIMKNSYPTNDALKINKAMDLMLSAIQLARG
jgi:hypothetical protein